MYLGVDIGGTKTLVAVLDDTGAICRKLLFPTPKHYEAFLVALENAAQQLMEYDLQAGCVAIPGKVDREHGVGEYFGNLPWKLAPIRADAERIFKCPILIENDAKLGGLSEAMLLPKDKKVLYVTISTGIGTGFVSNQEITPELADAEGGQMLLDYHGKREKWESFASGHAIVQRFGKKAADINDSRTWQRIAYDLAQGFIELIAIFQPDIIVIGGSVGRYEERFHSYLLDYIKQYHNPLITLPTIQQAQRPEEAVLYGCYDLAKRRYGRNA